MTPNKIKTALEKRKVLVGTMLFELKSPAVVEIIAAAGVDFIMIDMQHSVYDMETVADIVRVARLTGLSSIVRVPDRQPYLISRPLDAGANGVMVPMVEEKEEVEQIVRAVKYPPLGKRSCRCIGAHSDYKKVCANDFIERINRETLVIIQVETKRGIENIEQLTAVKGVDVALVGPFDLSISLGIAGEIEHPSMVRNIDKVVSACRKQGIACGIHTGNMKILQYWIKKGMQFAVYATDIALLREAVSSSIVQLRQCINSK